jgi:hypothetical protein
LEDWIVDKSLANGVTGWVSGCLGYQKQIIQGLEALVKFSAPHFLKKNVINVYSFGSKHDSGRRIVGKVRTGVVSECKKEFETAIFAMLETSIKLAKGAVESPAWDRKVDQVTYI